MLPAFPIFKGCFASVLEARTPSQAKLKVPQGDSAPPPQDLETPRAVGSDQSTCV